MSGGDEPELGNEDLAALEGLIPEAVGSPECIPMKQAMDVKLRALVMILNICVRKSPMAHRNNWCLRVG
jgi:hypothetical protein